MNGGELGQKSLRELKEIASKYGLSSVDLYGSSLEKTVWIEAISRAQSFSVEGIDSDTEKAINRVTDWLTFKTPKNTVNPTLLQFRLKMSKPCFWYAVYALREKGILDFEEPHQLEIKKHDKNRT